MIRFEKRYREDNKELGFFRSGFVLEVIEMKKEGKLQPKIYVNEVLIDYCPFCGEKLEPTPHLESCNCELCTTDRLFRGIPLEND